MFRSEHCRGFTIIEVRSNKDSRPRLVLKMFRSEHSRRVRLSQESGGDLQILSGMFRPEHWTRFAHEFNVAHNFRRCNPNVNRIMLPEALASSTTYGTRHCCC